MIRNPVCSLNIYLSKFIDCSISFTFQYIHKTVKCMKMCSISYFNFYYVLPDNFTNLITKSYQNNFPHLDDWLSLYLRGNVLHSNFFLVNEWNFVQEKKVQQIINCFLHPTSFIELSNIEGYIFCFWYVWCAWVS